MHLVLCKWSELFVKWPRKKIPQRNDRVRGMREWIENCDYEWDKQKKQMPS